jgi:hypothetical protein
MQWTIPTAEIADMCPNGDASQSHGYGASILVGDIIFFFSGEWSEAILHAKVNIAVLESWVVVMIASTWGHLFSGRKIIIRTDSAASCFCLNKLWSKSEGMAVICDIWEDLQHHFGFEGLVVHCKASQNKLADVCSREKWGSVEPALVRLLEQRGAEVDLQRVPLLWTAGNVDLRVEETVLANC